MDIDRKDRVTRNIREKSVTIGFQRGSNFMLPGVKNTRVARSMDGIRISDVPLSRRAIIGAKKSRAVVLPRKKTTASEVAPPQSVSDVPVLNESEEENKKRMFLKFAGAVGLGAVASLLVPGKAEAIVFGSTPASNTVGVKDASNARINPAKEDGNLATVKTNTDTLVTAGGGGFVRQDSTGTIAKESGGNLASVKINTDVFSASAAGGFVRQDSTGTIAKEVGGNLESIKTNTDKFTFDVSGNLLTAGGAAASTVGLTDTNSVRVNPATDDAIVYLRRMVKLMESQATVDAANRQRVTVDMFPGNVATLPTYTAGATLPTVTAVGTVTNITTISGQNQQMYQDVARNAYANGVRQNLIFS